MEWITPILGAALHFLAACAVIFNSARLVRFGEELHRPKEREDLIRPRIMPEPVPSS